MSAPEAGRDARTVLVVEDFDALRHALTRMLGRGGFRVLSANDAEGALGIAGWDHVEVAAAVVDLRLPDMQSRDLVRLLRQRWPGLRVLFVSGYPAEVAQQLGLLDPGEAFLPKPFTFAEVDRALRGVLEVPPETQ